MFGIGPGTQTGGGPPVCQNKHTSPFLVTQPSARLPVKRSSAEALSLDNAVATVLKNPGPFPWRGATGQPRLTGSSRAPLRKEIGRFPGRQVYERSLKPISGGGIGLKIQKNQFKY